MFDGTIEAIGSLVAVEDCCSFEAALAIVAIAALVGARDIAAVVVIVSLLEMS